MFEIITKTEFQDKMDYLIAITKQHALYAMDMVYPLLENGQDAEALPYIQGYGSLMDTLRILHNNIDMRLKDNLIPEENDMVYFMDETGMPSKTDQAQYDIIKNRTNKRLYNDEDEDIPYEGVPENPDNKAMFG